MYLWSAATSRVHKLCELGTAAQPDSVCSVAWSGRGSFLAVGTARNETHIWDVQKSQQCVSVLSLVSQKLYLLTDRRCLVRVQPGLSVRGLSSALLAPHWHLFSS